VEAKKPKEKTVVGRTEIVDFPELDLLKIEAKIDTGAYSTAIHAHKIWEEKVDGKKQLCFDLLDPTKKEYNPVHLCTRTYSRRNVRSSNGRLEKRYVIKTRLILGGKKRIVDVTLTDRGKMRYAVLIGRKVLKNGFLVDVSRKNVTKKK
jgi:hypothetical protein